ncbi:ABC transporter substrate-binding protein [Candidatus Giovannonibacteria bacterium]|nr:ABC transporter substrate-binding protein [Candidatus Giovannonibacteria bacterium]
MSTKYIVGFLIFLAVLLGGWYYFQTPQKMWKVAFLALSEKDIQSNNLVGFKKGMERLGYIEGKNIEYIIKVASRGEESDKMAALMNKEEYDIILTGSTSSTESFKKLPDLGARVFFLSAGRPADLVKNFSAPEGFITGIGEPTFAFTEKRIGFLKELLPSVKKIGTIIEHGHKTALASLSEVKSAADKLGIEVVVYEITTDKRQDLLEKLQFISKENGIDAYIACTCASNETYSKDIADYLIKAKIPGMNPEIEIGANIGWLVTFSNDRLKAGERAAESVDLILKGTPISKVPVEVAQDALLEVNKKTAESIGVQIPAVILERANKVY